MFILYAQENIGRLSWDHRIKPLFAGFNDLFGNIFEWAIPGQQIIEFFDEESVWVDVSKIYHKAIDGQITQIPGL